MKHLIKIAFICFSIGYCYGQEKQAVPYGSNHGKYISVKGTKMYYESYGTGTPLLLLHGGLSTISGFKNVIPELSKYFRVIAIDAPGQGRSEQADSVSFQLMASYYSEIIDQMKLDSVYVYGYSVGGISALHLASDRPDKVKMVIAHAAVSKLSGYNEGFAGTNEMTPEIIEQYAQWWLEGHLKRTPQKGKWRKFINDFRGMWYPHTFISDEKLRAIGSKVLVIQGDQDLVKVESAIEIHKQIKESQLCILPASTHFVLEENPRLLLDVIRPFLLRTPKMVYELSY